VALLAIAWALAAQRLRTHYQDVTIYSVTPDSKLQVIGLRHRTYLFDYGGESNLALLSTTYSTGVVTYGRKEDIFHAGQDEDHNQTPTTVPR
jgi:hypothetical protein